MQATKRVEWLSKTKHQKKAIKGKMSRKKDFLLSTDPP